jgi:acetyl-CoA carboxylase alpha subunit
LLEVEAEKKSIEQERVPVEKELAELEKQTSELKSEGPVDQLFLIEAEIEKLNKELKQALRHLQKPFKKMQALALYRGGAGLTPDERNKLSQYLQNPFKAFSTEQEGYPLLKQILQKM